MKKFKLSIICSLIGLFSYLPVDAIIDPNVPAIFYPFGSDVGDSVAPVNDDGSTSNIPISMGFPFFNSTNVNLYVNTNGVISFRNPCGTYTPDPFPVAYILISAYWCDVDTTRNNGRVYYRQSTDPELLNRATDDILPTYGPRGLGFFKAKWVFVATWHNVTFYGGGASTPVNTFQAVMVTDSKYSFTMYNYGVMRWTTGTASGGNSSGLGGIPAQVGFNAGDNINYFAVPGSRTNSILDIGRDSNIGVTGRWLFRIDNAEIEMPGCQSSEPCRAYQSMDANSRACLDTAPAFGCPTIDGPLENADHVIEFFCKVPTNVTDTRALFGVTFLFDGEPDLRMPIVVIRASDAKAAMHEMYLAGKMGKWVGCSVRSYWDYATQNKSRALTSTNSFWAGVKTTKDVITVEERSQALPSLLLQSALPIVCTPVGNGHQECELHFNLGLVDGSQDILLGKQNSKKCTYLIKGSDWKPDEKLAYDDNSPLRFAARQDAFQTSARFSMVSFKVDDLPRRTAGGQTFANIWSNYSLPSVWVYRYDQGGATCTSTGDPNLKTFDSLRYSIYNSGQFIYSQSTFGIPFEVHVRHNQCTSGSLSCVCGVAMREGDLILAADMCGPDKRVHYLTCNTSSIQDGAGITTSSMGNSFRIQLPSGNKVVGYVNGWGMTIEVYVMASDRGRTEGLCGSYDNNPSNDIKEKGTSNFYPISGGVAPAAVLRSWQIPTGQSLFDCYRSDLPTGGVGTDLKGAFCTCNNGGQNCGVGLHDTASDLWEPSQTVVPNVPASSVLADQPRRRRRSTYDNNDVINDNIDYDYDSGSFNFTDPIRDEDNVWNFTWPTWNGITYAQAYQHCYSILWIDSPIQQDCSSFVSDEDVQGIVNECVSDIKATGDLTWVNDKISEIQLECINRIVSYPNDDNDTAMAIGAALASVQTVLQYICVPSDCSGHGSCTNGTCQCQSGYIGSDCSVPVSSVPSIVRVLDPVICDVRQRRCQSLQMITSEMSDLPDPTCKIQVTKLGDSYVETYLTRAWITSPTTSTCDLPTELLQGFSNNVNFTEAAIQAGARNFSLISPGNPVMIYQVSMSNNGVTFSEPVVITVVDSLCYSCSDDRCSRLSGTCSINGYCFVDGDVSPYRLCDLCKTSVSEISWSTIWGLPCYLDPCLSSPCPDNMTCSVVSETDFECSENDTIPSGHCTDQESRNGFVCDDKNPCTEANLNNGCYTFPSIDASKYVQCGGVNQCTIASCDPGFIWSREEKGCVLDGSI